MRRATSVLALVAVGYLLASLFGVPSWLSVRTWSSSLFHLVTSSVLSLVITAVIFLVFVAMVLRTVRKRRATTIEENEYVKAAQDILRSVERMQAWDKWLPRIALASIVALGIVAAGGYLFHWEWTGVVPYYGPSANNRDFQREKTLWDWLQLFVVPLTLSVVSVVLAQREKQWERFITSNQANRDREAVQERDRENALNSYIDQIADLQLNHGLGTAEELGDVRRVARARTLMVLKRLDGKRKAALINFLYQSGLILKPDPVITLEQADLTQVDFSFMWLPDIDLSKAHIRQANFSSAQLPGAEFRGCFCILVNLEGANLSGANLSDSVWALVDFNLPKLEGTVLTKCRVNGPPILEEQLAKAGSTEGFQWEFSELPE